METTVCCHGDQKVPFDSKNSTSWQCCNSTNKVLGEGQGASIHIYIERERREKVQVGMCATEQYASLIQQALISDIGDAGSTG